MKHYPHHIGDFDKATRHLTRIERSIYRDLLDLYYGTEAQISLDLSFVCRKIIATSNEESTATQRLLNEFFTETPTGWYHDRCEHEISAYHANTSQKAMAGKASAAAKRLKKQQAMNGTSTAVQQPLNSVATAGNGTSTNHQPINQSTNQPLTKQEKQRERRTPPAKPIDQPGDVDPQTWADFIALRNKKRAPVTATVINGARQESSKAGMTLEAFLQVWCRRGSQGLEASWLKPDELSKSGGQIPNRQEALEARNRAVVARMMEKENQIVTL
jgi:uncharacterized protein YdaU (DUF1376 family)